jgi:hypothetical protein
MATKQHYFTGKAKWAKVYKPDEKYNNFAINIELDDASKKEFDGTGIRVQPKKDESDGLTYYRFRRSEEDGPPLVVDNQGEPFSKLIGNGSNVTVRVESYDSKKYGKGHRLQAVRINDWVEFDAEKREVKLPDKMVDGSIPF